MDALGITWETIVAGCGGIIVLFQVGKLLMGMFSPIKNLVARVDKHDALLDSDNREIKAIKASNSATHTALFALLNQFIKQSPSDELLAARDKLQTHLVEK